MLAVLPDATLYYGAADTGMSPVAGSVRNGFADTGVQGGAALQCNGVMMTETELKEIEARLPKGAERVGAHLDASHLAAEVRNSWSEGAELRQGLANVRNSGARVAQESEAAGAMAERYKVERDELVERCARLRKTLAELLNGLQSAPEGDVALTEVLTKARNLLEAS